MASAISFAFNQEHLASLVQEGSATIIFSLCNLRADNETEMYACAYGQEAPASDHVRVGCPYPPGWKGDIGNPKPFSAQDLTNVPMFAISHEKLAAIIAQNEYEREGVRQVIVRVEGEVMDDQLTTFLEAFAYSHSLQRKASERILEFPIAPVPSGKATILNQEKVLEN